MIDNDPLYEIAGAPDDAGAADKPERRTRQDYAALRVEAQRRVRAGEKGARVARSLGVAIATFQHWQAEDGFRLIDLRHEAATGTRALPPAWVARHNGRRNNREKLPLPEDYVQKIALQRELVMTREAQLRAARRADPGVAGRVALGEAARLQREGDYDAAERAAKLGERFLRMKARIDGVMDRWPGQAYKGQKIDPWFREAPVDAGKSYAAGVKARLDALIARKQRETREAAAEPSEQSASPSFASSGAGEAAQGLGRLAEGAEEGAAHPLGIAEA